METEIIEKESILVKLKNNKKMTIIGIVIALALGTLAFVLITRPTYDDLTAQEIYELMIENEEVSERLEGYDSYLSKKQDPNGILGDEGTYISKVAFDDKETRVEEADMPKNMTIEVFRNEDDTKLRVKEVEESYNTINEVYPLEEYGTFVLEGLGVTEQYITRIGNAVFRVSNTCSKDVADLYTEAFKNALADKTYSQYEILEESIDERLKDKLKAVEAQCKLVQGELNTEMDGMRDQMNFNAESLRTNFDEETFEIFKSDVEALDIGYFKDDIEGWRVVVTEIQAVIDEENRVAQEEADRQAALSAGRQSAGMYKVGVDIPAGEYVIIGDGYFEISSDSSGTLDSIIANDNFKGNSIVTVSDGQYLTVKNASFYDIALNPTISTTGSGMFKVGLHIPAGEYKVAPTGTSSGGITVSNASTHSIYVVDAIEIIDGEYYITVKEGQYLTLSYAKIVQ
jgi:flagellar hook assembly protein FlgD